MHEAPRHISPQRFNIVILLGEAELHQIPNTDNAKQGPIRFADRQMAEIALIHDLKRGFHRRIGANHHHFAGHDFFSGQASYAIPPIRHRLHNVTLTQNAGDLAGAGHDQHGTNAARGHDAGDFHHGGFGGY